MDDYFYEMCGNEFCYFFVEENHVGESPTDDGLVALVKYVHLDDGEQEHWHDAVPSGKLHRLSWWKMAYPQLFTGYPDGKIGPNSIYFVG